MRNGVPYGMGIGDRPEEERRRLARERMSHEERGHESARERHNPIPTPLTSSF